MEEIENRIDQLERRLGLKDDQDAEEIQRLIRMLNDKISNGLRVAGSQVSAIRSYCALRQSEEPLEYTTVYELERNLPHYVEKIQQLRQLESQVLGDDAETSSQLASLHRKQSTEIAPLYLTGLDLLCSAHQVDRQVGDLLERYARQVEIVESQLTHLRIRLHSISNDGGRDSE